MRDLRKWEATEVHFLLTDLEWLVTVRRSALLLCTVLRISILWLTRVGVLVAGHGLVVVRGHVLLHGHYGRYVHVDVVVGLPLAHNVVLGRGLSHEAGVATVSDWAGANATLRAVLLHVIYVSRLGKGKQIIGARKARMLVLLKVHLAPHLGEMLVGTFEVGGHVASEIHAFQWRSVVLMPHGGHLLRQVTRRTIENASLLFGRVPVEEDVRLVRYDDLLWTGGRPAAEVSMVLRGIIPSSLEQPWLLFSVHMSGDILLSQRGLLFSDIY